MLIRAAELLDGRSADVRIADGHIAAIGTLAARGGEPTIDANGGLLLPGLHDHHIHLAALAASLASVRCGPPEVSGEAELAAALDRPGAEWLRGIGYHESVAGMLDRHRLDRLAPDRPVRVQHRSGRMWFLNSAAMEILLTGRDAPDGLDLASGRLFDADAWLRAALGSRPPSFAEASRRLARIGVTGLTDMSPANDGAAAEHFAAEHRRGALRQDVLLAGTLGLGSVPSSARIAIGPAKLHLHEAELPALDDVVAFARAAHRSGRAVAVHCVSEVELLYTLAMFDEAGAVAGDRIEHAAVTPDFAVDRIAALGLAVVSQPHFVAERGDAYLRDVEPDARPLLYRLRAFRDAGVTLAGGSDAPFGQADPWAAMAAAICRQTRSGIAIAPEEALTAEQALDLFLRDPVDLGTTRAVTIGARADLCLLYRPWAQARQALASNLVRAVFAGGRRIDDGIDQPPA